MLVFEDDGKIREYAGGYSDWLRQGHALTETDNPLQAEERRRRAAERKAAQKPTKLSYKDQRELDLLPGEIEALEQKLAELQEAIAEPGFYTQPQPEIQATLKELGDTEASLESRVDRWGELESLRASYQSGC